MAVKNNWKFYIVCLLLAAIAEISLLEEIIGVSYSVFIAAFYMVFFIKFRKTPFSHKQISFLLFLAIWLLTISYVLYSNPIFYLLNFLVIPFLVFVHTVLLTSPTYIKWHSLNFVSILAAKIPQAFSCGMLSIKASRRRMKQSINESTYSVWKRIGIGAIISLPLLTIVTILLTSADQNFANLLGNIPEKLLNFNAENIFRVIKIIIIGIVFYCFFKIVHKKTKAEHRTFKELNANWDGIIAATTLMFINIVYLLFTAVQFQYFFSGSLETGFTYAEYARRGFFELVLVTVINFIILLSVTTFVQKGKKGLLVLIKIMLSLLVTFSGVMLVSAFLRLTLYEQAFGFTYIRLLVHAFMIFLFIIFIFTLIKVWVVRLSITRFYILSALVFYVGLNLIGIDNIIINKNIERFKETGQIDVYYLNSLSFEAVPELVELYKNNPNIPELKLVIEQKKESVLERQLPWQSYNYSLEKARDALRTVD